MGDMGETRRDNLLTLSNVEIEQVSGGWATASGVLTAQFYGAPAPSVYNVINNKAGITVGVGTTTAPQGIPF
jgi:hypothetical protein